MQAKRYCHAGNLRYRKPTDKKSVTQRIPADMGMTTGLLNSIKTHYDNKIFYYFKKRSQLELNNKNPPNGGIFILRI
jgi:hypothetical protein